LKYRTTSSLPLSAVPVLVSALVLPACATASERDLSAHRSSKHGDPVVFEAVDGVRLIGRVFGEGAVGVVLAHMGRAGDTQADFYPLARELAERGYLALTYNRRGVCGAGGRDCSQGFDDFASSWNDVVGAVEAVRSRGATSVVLIGASIGAMAALYAAVSHRVEPAALIEIGGVNHESGYCFSREQLQQLTGAKLFVSSAHDVYGGAEAAREWHGWANEPKQLEILAGAQHGTDMLRQGEPTAKPLVELVLRFLMRIVPPRGHAVSAVGRDVYRNPTPGAAIALQIPGMHRAVVRRNVPYARRGGRTLRLDVYRPAASRPRARFPGVLLVHGSTSDPSPKDWGIYAGWGQLLAASGLAGIPFNHRGTRADIRAALASVRRRAPEIGVDGSRLCVASFSGGVGAGLAAALSDDRVRCALALYGAPDPASLEPDSPPTFVAKAGRDSSYINEAIDAYVARAHALGADVRLVVHPRAAHGFDVAPGDARTRSILRQAIAFSRAQLGVS
jgi:dienelactone hydrolase